MNQIKWILMTLVATLFFRYLWIIIPAGLIIGYFRNDKKSPGRAIVITMVVISLLSLGFFIITSILPIAEGAAGLESLLPFYQERNSGIDPEMFGAGIPPELLPQD